MTPQLRRIYWNSIFGTLLLLAFVGFSEKGHFAHAASLVASSKIAPFQQTGGGVGQKLFLPLAMSNPVAPKEEESPDNPNPPQATPNGGSGTIPEPDVPATPTPAAPTPTPQQPSGYESGNPCADNEFLDLTANVCRKLDRPDLGFDFGRYYSWLDENNVINADCSESSFEEALEQAKGGGIVRLPACTMEIGRINVPSKVVIEGAGVGKTILKGSGCDNSSPRRVLLIINQSDVVLRGVSLDAGDRNCVMLEVDRSTNVLIERLEIYDSTEVGMRFNNGTRKITIRYTDIYNNGEYHAIGSKDCATGATISSCPEEMWTSSYSIHSNKLHDHGDHGLNLHGINGEVAGNLSYNNHHSGKFYDAQCIWVHHNEFRNNESWNVFIAPTLDIEARASHDIYFYKNQYLETPSGTYSWGISYTGDNVTLPLEKFAHVYVMDNQYAGRLKTNEVPLNICPNTSEAGLSVSPSRNGNAATCNLGSYPSMGGNVSPTPLGNCPAP